MNASLEHVRNQGHHKSEAHGREKIKEGWMQETSSRQEKMAEGINGTRNDDSGLWIMNGGKKIWRKKREEEQEG